MEKNNKVLIDKMMNNSCYRKSFNPNIFYISSAETAKQITETGKKILRDLIKKWEKEL